MLDDFAFRQQKGDQMSRFKKLAKTPTENSLKRIETDLKEQNSKIDNFRSEIFESIENLSG